jgi:cytochrome c oxidase cbb3-type subunit 4
MDVNDARAVVTVLSLILFLGIVFWAWSGRRRSGFDEAARLPFADADSEPAGEKQ